MKWKDEDLAVLKSLETCALNIYRAHPEMTDYAALRGFEAAYKFYRDQGRGHTPKPHSLKNFEAEVFEAVYAECEIQLGRRAGPATAPRHQPVPLVKLLDYLRELTKSVERHTQIGGRQGYLNFIDKYIM